MSNLVKIKDVVLYTAITEHAGECYACKKLLRDSNIAFKELCYADESTHQENFDALGTWAFGSDYRSVKFTKFPIIHWTEFYDDWNRYVEVVDGLEQLKQSNLLKNAAKVDK